MDTSADSKGSKKPDSRSWRSPYTSTNPDLYFQDGKRRIDFVLVYSQLDPSAENASKREAFLTGLAEEMIEIEVEDCSGNVLGRTGMATDTAPLEPDIEASLSVALKASVHPPGPSEPRNPSAVRHEAISEPPSAMDRYRIQAQEDELNLGPNDLVFVKLYAPWQTMGRYAEMFNLRKPLKSVRRRPSPERSATSQCCQCCTAQSSRIIPLETTFTWPFSLKRQFLFDIPEERDEFFTASERALVVDYILRRTRCVLKNQATSAQEISDDEVVRAKVPLVGITRLLSDGTFMAAYPLHEFDEKLQKYYDSHITSTLTITNQEVAPASSEQKNLELNNRTLLKRYWASYKSFARVQPIDYVRYYFGEAIAFYFAWLGFYTACLTPVALLGVLVFLLGLIRMNSDAITKDVCEWGKDVLMCPPCRLQNCKFWRLNASCFRNKLTNLVDNEGTVLFGVIMALWAILFLELWKRQQFALGYHWQVHTLEPIDQPARPEFLALLDKGYMGRRNPISGNIEPVIPFWRKRIPLFALSYSTVLFAVVLTLACLVGVILYKLVMKIIFYQQPNAFVKSAAGMLTTITGSVINLLLIFVLQFIYDRVAISLTNLENHRAQIDYDNSLTLKLYMLQFVNYYSSIFYIAFIQGPTAALPGSSHLIVQSTGCDQGDCLFELFLQLTIIMVGKQLLNFVKETMMPIILFLFNRIRFRIREIRTFDATRIAAALEASNAPQDVTNRLLACRSNFILLDPGSRPLFNEYLEMMIQYGFITMFVPAFPLAPFFGFLNNLFEIRGDAKKFINQYRRPVVDRVKTIGIWFSILMVLSAIAIRTNACVIAFTTQFIDRWVYRMHYSPDGTDVGFKNFTLSYMLSDRFPDNASQTYCRYDDFRKPPWDDPEMSRTIVYYHVLAVKFIFVFIFETVAVLMTSILAAIIADVPGHIKRQIYHEINEINRIITYAEMRQFRVASKSDQSLADMLRKDALATLQEAEKEESTAGFLSLHFFSMHPTLQSDPSF